MKNSIVCLLLILSCKKNDGHAGATTKIQKPAATNPIETRKADDGEPGELPLPYCFKIDTLPKSNYYQTNLDTFLIRHHLKRNSLLGENKNFHKNTEDFISERQGNFMHYPYGGKAYAVKKLTINDKVKAIFYAYLFDSEMIQPRIEVQTFDNNQNNIDNLIIASTFSSECSGYRDFCVGRDKVITISNFYYCSDIGTKYQNEYRYKITDSGKFVYAAQPDEK